MVSFAHSFFIAVGVEGVRIFMSCGVHPKMPYYTLSQYIARDGARLRSWDKAQKFVDDFMILSQLAVSHLLHRDFPRAYNNDSWFFRIPGPPNSTWLLTAVSSITCLRQSLRPLRTRRRTSARYSNHSFASWKCPRWPRAISASSLGTSSLLRVSSRTNLLKWAFRSRMRIQLFREKKGKAKFQTGIICGSWMAWTATSTRVLRLYYDREGTRSKQQM